MYKKILVATLAAAGLVSAAQAETPWLVRARAVYVDFDNGQKNGLQTNVGAKVSAEDRWIPEVDISYFLTKNIAAELVLTYPQDVDIKVGATKLGTIKALPPSLMLQYHFTDLGAFKPYVGLGVNYTIFSKRNIGGSGVKVDDSSTGLAAQVGADYLIDKNWSVNLDVKYIKMDTDVKAGGTTLGKLDLSPYTIGLGVGYRF